jgi:hypothetical protein
VYSFGKNHTIVLSLQVKKRASKCKCCPRFSIDRLSEGRYNIGGKVVFIRVSTRKAD